MKIDQYEFPDELYYTQDTSGRASRELVTIAFPSSGRTWPAHRLLEVPRAGRAVTKASRSCPWNPESGSAG